MKIAICGTAQSANYAPIGEVDWKIWSLPPNIQRWGGKDKADEWFELHEIPYLLDEYSDTPGFKELMLKFGNKLTIIHKSAEFPEAKVYPRQAVIDEFGPYFTSSIAWLLGLAIMNKPDVIGIWGVNCSGSNEYAEQRACIEYLIGIARGKGITIQIHQDSMLLKGFLYHDASSQRICKKLKAMDAKADYTRDLANYERGYVDALKFMKLGLGE